MYDEKLCEWCKERCTDRDNVVLVVVKSVGLIRTKFGYI